MVRQCQNSGLLTPALRGRSAVSAQHNQNVWHLTDSGRTPPKQLATIVRIDSISTRSRTENFTAWTVRRTGRNRQCPEDGVVLHARVMTTDTRTGSMPKLDHWAQCGGAVS